MAQVSSADHTHLVKKSRTRHGIAHTGVDTPPTDYRFGSEKAFHSRVCLKNTLIRVKKMGVGLKGGNVSGPFQRVIFLFLPRRNFVKGRGKMTIFG
jgi:hypothetical protein